MPLERLDAGVLRSLVVGYAAALDAHRERLDALNVYPVPDSDTGTNMARTMRAVVEDLPAAGADLASVARAVADGSLLGARGNSSGLLSQLLRGLVGALATEEDGGTDGAGTAAALAAAAEAGYGAVAEPVEGTILTVARAAADGARGRSLVDVLDSARVAAATALARTPEQLPALAEAGVVDAGGAGFLLLLDAALEVVDARPIPGPGHAAARRVARTPEPPAGPRYEVTFLLAAEDHRLPAFRDTWAGVGESVAIVGGDGSWSCHVHTDDIGAAVEAGIEAGRPSRIRVEDLHAQVAACRSTGP